MNERYRLRENLRDSEEQWSNYETAKDERDYEIVAATVKNLLLVTDKNWIKKLFK